MITPDDYRGFEKEKIALNPKLQLAWDLAQIIDDGAPIGWWKHVSTASCLLVGYDMVRKGWQ
jgi:hypothetical protein